MSDEQKPLAVVAMNLKAETPIVYLRRFYEALAAHGVVLCDEPLHPAPAWAKRMGKWIDAIHIHWPEYLWKDDLLWLRRHAAWAFRLPGVGRSLVAAVQVLRLGRFALFLRAARRAGLRVVWTMHNLEIHEGSGVLDRLGYRMLYKSADMVICHDDTTRRHCARLIQPGAQALLMHHGNYVGSYPSPRPRDEVLRELGLSPDLPVACCLGGLRDYKGLDVACAAAALLGDEIQLVVAGPPHSAFDVESLRRSVRALPRAVLIDRRLTDSEFVDVGSAGDLILLPYRKITTSGLLLAAISLGRPVVASDLPYMREVLGHSPESGILVVPGDATALAEGVRELLRKPEGVRVEAARRLARQYDWERVVQPVIEVFTRWHEASEGALRRQPHLEYTPSQRYGEGGL